MKRRLRLRSSIEQLEVFPSASIVTPTSDLAAGNLSEIIDLMDIRPHQRTQALTRLYGCQMRPEATLKGLAHQDTSTLCIKYTQNVSDVLLWAIACSLLPQVWQSLTSLWTVQLAGVCEQFGGAPALA